MMDAVSFPLRCVDVFQSRKRMAPMSRASDAFVDVFPSFTGFYWVLLGFTEIFYVLLSFTGFYWFLLGFTEFYREFFYGWN